MRTIQKRAIDLRPGHIIVASRTGVRRVVIGMASHPHFGLKNPTGDLETVHLEGDFWGKRVDESMKVDDEFTVESPGLTPAQQYAEELAGLLREAAVSLRQQDNVSLVRDIDTLLDKIKPPEPPTLEEALAMVDELSAALATGGACERAEKLLDRARRAGVLKDGRQ